MTDDARNFTRYFVENAEDIKNSTKLRKVINLPAPDEDQKKQIEERGERLSKLPKIIPGNEFPALYDIPPQRYIIDGLVGTNDFMAVFAEPKTLKSQLVEQAAVAAASGLPFLGRETKKSKVLIIDGEMNKHRLQERLIKIATERGLDGVPENLHIWPLHRVTGDLDLIVESLKAQMIDQEPYAWVILDPCYAITSANLTEYDENNNKQVALMLRALEDLVKDTEAALTIVHHFRKSTDGSTMSRAAGAGAFTRWPSVLFMLSWHEMEDCQVIEVIGRNFKTPDPFVIQHEPPALQLRPDLDPSKLRRNGQRGKPRVEPVDVVKGYVPQAPLKISKSQLYFSCSQAGLNEEQFLEGLAQAKEDGLNVMGEGPEEEYSL